AETRSRCSDATAATLEVGPRAPAPRQCRLDLRGAGGTRATLDAAGAPAGEPCRLRRRSRTRLTRRTLLGPAPELPRDASAAEPARSTARAATPTAPGRGSSAG